MTVGEEVQRISKIYGQNYTTRTYSKLSIDDFIYGKSLSNLLNNFLNYLFNFSDQVWQVQLRRHRSRHWGGRGFEARLRCEHGSLHSKTETTQTGHHYWTTHLWISGGKKTWSDRDNFKFNLKFGCMVKSNSTHPVSSLNPCPIL